MRIEPKHWSELAPGLLELPRPNHRLRALAVDLARRAAPVLDPGSTMLTVERDAGVIRLAWWRHDLERAAEITCAPTAFAPPATVEGALQRAGEALLDYLAGRWPVGTAPERIGVLTDGRGVAFSPDHPAPGVPGWMLRQMGTDGGLRSIVPLDLAGAARRLLAAEVSSSVH